MIYCDNASTSFPKPQAVYDAAYSYMTTVGASPGRSAHTRAVKADRIVFDTRERLASLFAIDNSARLVFTQNATESINTALFGILKQGDRVAVSSMEHNAVIRPLRYLEKSRGIVVDMIQCSATGEFDLALWDRHLRNKVKIAIVNHGSNVIGSIAPIHEIGVLCKQHGVLFCVDAAQTAGLCNIDVGEINVDVLAFSGHKGLYGSAGTGGLYIREGIDCNPLKFGGTGSDSESDDQPVFLPDSFESGTMNGSGLAALGAGVKFVSETGVDSIFTHGNVLTRMLIDELKSVAHVKMIGLPALEPILPTLSIVVEGMDGSDLMYVLDKEYGIATRVGMHCAPWAHRTIGTFPTGTVRLSFGYFNTESDVVAIVNALKDITAQEVKSF